MWKIRGSAAWIGPPFAIMSGIALLTMFVDANLDFEWPFFAFVVTIFAASLYAWLTKKHGDRKLARLKAEGTAYAARITDISEFSCLIFTPRIRPYRNMRFTCIYYDDKGAEHIVKSRWYAVRKKKLFSATPPMHNDDFRAMVYADPYNPDDYAVDLRAADE